MPAIRRRIWDVLDGRNPKDRLSGNLNAAILTLIFFNVVAVILETVDTYHEAWAWQFHAFELFSVAVFTVEYLLRLWTCTSAPEYQGAIRGRIKFMLSPMALIDLVAIVPFYLPFILGNLDARMLRALRLMRLFRLFKAGRYAETIKVMARVVASRKEELLITAFVLLLTLILASSLMYYVEREAQPVAFGSIPAAMWWGVITLTTVGYGDVAPITPLGKACATAIAAIGIGMFGLPAGIIASGFMDEIQKKAKAEEATARAKRTDAHRLAHEQGICPHCHLPLPARRDPEPDNA